MQTKDKSGTQKPKVILFLNVNIVDLEPTAFTQVSKDPKWKEAILKEFNSLITNETLD